jgi:hypothetical protein
MHPAMMEKQVRREMTIRTKMLSKMFVSMDAMVCSGTGEPPERIFSL